MSVVTPQYFQIFPRVNLSFDKLAYTGSDSCFGWLETQGAGIHFTVVAKKSVLVCISFFFFFSLFNVSGHVEGAPGVAVVQ